MVILTDSLICKRGEDCRCQSPSVHCFNSVYPAPTFPTTAEIAAKQRAEQMESMSSSLPSLEDFRAKRDKIEEDKALDHRVYTMDALERAEMERLTRKLDAEIQALLTDRPDDGPDEALQENPALRRLLASTPPWEKKGDGIPRPSYYARFSIEPVTFCMLNNLPFWASNVVKYVCRAPYKHETEEADIKKAIRYCEMRLEELKRRQEGTIGDVAGRPL